MTPCGETWLTSDNKLVALHDMNPRHLENTINHLWSKHDSWEDGDELDMIEAMKQELERRQALREQHGAGVAPF